MTSTRKKILVALALFLAVWVPTLGLHLFHTMRVYCQNCDAEGSLRVWASVRPDNRFVGVPFVLGVYRDRLPYPLHLFVTVDELVEGHTLRIHTLRMEFAGGDAEVLLEDGRPEAIELVPHEPWNARQMPAKRFRRARFQLPEAVRRREPFTLVVEGSIEGGAADPPRGFLRRLEFEPRPELDLVTGWDLIEGLGV